MRVCIEFVRLILHCAQQELLSGDAYLYELHNFRLVILMNKRGYVRLSMKLTPLPALTQAKNNIKVMDDCFALMRFGNIF